MPLDIAALTSGLSSTSIKMVAFGAALVAIVSWYETDTEREAEEVLYEHQQDQTMIRTIGNHQRDKIRIELRLNEVELNILEQQPIDQLTPQELRRIETLSQQQVQLQESFTIAQEYLDTLGTVYETN